MAKTPDDVRKLAKEAGIKIVDLKFVDLPGVWQHFSIPVQDLNDDLFSGWHWLRRLEYSRLSADP